MNLYEYNQICVEKFKSLEPYDLIEKIIFNKEDTEEIGSLIKKNYGGYYHPWEQVYPYKEAITVFLVGCAKYFYNNGEGGFWDAVKKLTDYSQNFKNELIRAFKTTISLYGLEKFDEERVSYFTQMGSILAHAGLAENLESALIYTIAGLDADSISFENLGEELISQSIYATESIKSYLNILNKLGTLNDVVFDIIQFFNNPNNCTDETLSISVSLQEKIIEFKQNRNKRETQTQRIITRPQLYYDIDENQIYIEFPEQTIDDCDYLTWNIYNGDEFFKKIVDAEYINSTYHFRSTLFKINPSSRIKVQLKDDKDCVVFEHIIKETKEPILFNEKGMFVKNNILTDKGGFVLIDNNYLSEKVININDYEETSLYSVEPREEEIIVFRANNLSDVNIYIRGQIELLYEEKLISESCKFSGLDGFYLWPKFQIPHKGLWEINVNVEGEKFHIKKDVEEDKEIMDLGEYLKDDVYGKVNIRFSNNILGVKTFRFILLPKIQMTWLNYSTTHNERERSFIKFEKTNDCVVLDGNSCFQDKYEILEEIDVFKGFYKYKEKKYFFKLNLRYFSWIFENDEGIIGKKNVFSRFSVKDISLAKSCLLTFKNNTEEKVYLIFDNGSEERKIFAVSGHSRKIINLKEYIEYLSSNENAARLYVEQNFKNICELCSIRKNLAIRNLELQNFSNLFMLSWEEDGLKRNREIKCRKIESPYEFFTIPLEEGRTEYVFDNEDERFNEGLIFEICLKKEQDIFSCDDEQEDLLDYTNSVIFNKNNVWYGFNFQDNYYQDFKNAIYTFLTYRFNKRLFEDENQYKNLLESLLRYIFRNRILLGDEVLLEILFSYKLSLHQFERIRKDFALMFPILKKDKKLKKSHWNSLEQYDKLLFVIYTFFKKDDDCLNKVSAFNFSYLMKFKDEAEQNFMWATVNDLFPKIIEFPEIEKLKEMAKYLNKNLREVEAYLEAIIECFSKAYDRNDENKILEYKMFARYIENIRAKYSSKLINTILRHLSRMR